MGGWIANILLSFDYQHNTHISVYLPLSTFQQKQGIQSTFEVRCWCYNLFRWCRCDIETIEEKGYISTHLRNSQLTFNYKKACLNNMKHKNIAISLYKEWYLTSVFILYNKVFY